MARYDNQNILFTKDADNNIKPYYRGKFYPNIPLSSLDSYVVTTIGDRLDLLAYRFYRDTELWWVIAAANNNATKGALFPAPGTQLRIPSSQNLSNILSLFEQFNNAR
jgi:nucleoid-associated protein YgaU